MSNLYTTNRHASPSSSKPIFSFLCYSDENLLTKTSFGDTSVRDTLVDETSVRSTSVGDT